MIYHSIVEWRHLDKILPDWGLDGNVARVVPPPTVRQALTIVIAAGFFAVLVLAWYHGEQGRQRASGVELLMLAALLAIAGTAIALVRGDEEPAGTAASAPAPGREPAEASIAVLPFDNMSADPENEYFADGLAEEILNALTRVPGLEVAARTSSFSFKDKDADIPTIAAALGVRTVLEGSVRKSGDRLRITAQLVDAENGLHLWSETYDRELDDIFVVQEEIARAIVGALQVRLTAEAPLVERPTESQEAYEEYLRGRFLWNRRTVESLQAAVGRFQHAVELDPDFALAWAGLADAHLTLMWYLTDADWDALLESGREAAERALALDSELGQAHVALGLYHAARFDWERANRGFERGLALDPRYATGRYWYGLELSHQGRWDEALEQARMAVEIDPLSLVNARGYGMLLMWAGRLDEARVQLDRVLELDPGFAPVWQTYGRLNVMLGRWDEAAESYTRNADLRGLDPEPKLGAIRAIEEYRTTGRRIPMPGLEDLPADERATLYALAGWTEEAMAIVEHARETGNPDLREWGVEPGFAPLHDDPRFVAALRTAGVRPAPEARGWLAER